MPARGFREEILTPARARRNCCVLAPVSAAAMGVAEDSGFVRGKAQSA